MKFLDLSGVSILWRRIKETFARKSETVSDISRDDTTFTVTKADGTTFEFTQKDTTYDVATTTASGLMSATDKAKLNGVVSGAQPNVIESVSVNGAEQSVTAKGIDITVPTALSDLTDDVGYLTEESDPTVPTWAKQPQKPAYTASEVGALPADTHIPTNVSELNNDAGYLTEHQDISGIEDAIAGLTTKLNALADSDDTTLDQLSEIVAYIKNNKSLIDGITTGKVSVDDIVDNLTSTAANKPLSAKQGKALKDMIDAIVVPTKVSQLTNDAGYLTQHQDISGKANSADLSAIATSGSYTDLTDKPTIPVVDNTLTVTGAAADAKKTGDELSSLKEDLQSLSIRPSYTKYEGKLVRTSGLDTNANFDTYRYEIPDNVESIHITTNFYGQVYIIFSDKDYDATFNNFPFAQYPDSGYEDPTDVDVDLSTHGFKYVYVPFRKASSVVPDAYYSELPLVDNKVDKNGSEQVNEANTTFFSVKESRNIVNVQDDTITDSPLTLVASNNHFVTTISTPLTSRVMPIFHEMLLEAGTYTFTVLADDDYSTLGGGTFVGLYTGENKNVLYQYAGVTYPVGTSKTFTLSEDTTVYFRFRTQDLTEANANYSAFGYIGFRMMLSKTGSAIPWENPKPKYICKYAVDPEVEFANVAMFEKIGVIGDSYASGQIYISGSPVNYYNLSWGQVLARRVGASCLNLSRGGLTTKTWLESDRGLSYLQSNDPQCLYVVALGINDYTEINAGRYSLGTESDFDLSDYENTPDTFFGNMCKIIGYVKTKSSNAKIILSTMALNNNTLRKSINNAIERCAELANIVSVRQYEDVFFNSDYYANGMVSEHPTAPTYSGMATAMERLINNCMDENYGYFSTYTWA